MTTIDGRDTLPSPSNAEVHLSPAELETGAIYEIDSGYLEPVGYCVDPNNFCGLHLEARGNVWSLRIGFEQHRQTSEQNGVDYGALPLKETLPAQDVVLNDPETKKRDLAILLAHQLLQFYNRSLETGYHPILDKEEVRIKINLFTQILASWDSGTLPLPDIHGFVDLTPLIAGA